MIQIINCIEISDEEYLLDSLDTEQRKEIAAMLRDHVMKPLGFTQTA